eukprot:jgi/Mesvir1/13459/Mv16518-RA.1
MPRGEANGERATGVANRVEVDAGRGGSTAPMDGNASAGARDAASTRGGKLRLRKKAPPAGSGLTRCDDAGASMHDGVGDGRAPELWVEPRHAGGRPMGEAVTGVPRHVPAEADNMGVHCNATRADTGADGGADAAADAPTSCEAIVANTGCLTEKQPTGDDHPMVAGNGNELGGSRGSEPSQMPQAASAAAFQPRGGGEEMGGDTTPHPFAAALAHMDEVLHQYWPLLSSAPSTSSSSPFLPPPPLPKASPPRDPSTFRPARVIDACACAVGACGAGGGTRREHPPPSPPAGAGEVAPEGGMSPAGLGAAAGVVAQAPPHGSRLGVPSRAVDRAAAQDAPRDTAPHRRGGGALAGLVARVGAWGGGRERLGTRRAPTRRGGRGEKRWVWGEPPRAKRQRSPGVMHAAAGEASGCAEEDGAGLLVQPLRFPRWAWVAGKRRRGQRPIVYQRAGGSADRELEDLYEEEEEEGGEWPPRWCHSLPRGICCRCARKKARAGEVEAVQGRQGEAGAANAAVVGGSGGAGQEEGLRAVEQHLQAETESRGGQMARGAADAHPGPPHVAFGARQLAGSGTRDLAMDDAHGDRGAGDARVAGDSHARAGMGGVQAPHRVEGIGVTDASGQRAQAARKKVACSSASRPSDGGMHLAPPAAMGGDASDGYSMPRRLSKGEDNSGVLRRTCAGAEGGASADLDRDRGKAVMAMGDVGQQMATERDEGGGAGVAAGTSSSLAGWGDVPPPEALHQSWLSQQAAAPPEHAPQPSGGDNGPVACPVCGMSLSCAMPNASINAHIDVCLNKFALETGAFD